MIIVRLMGGLGNQMFQYATARRLAHIHGTHAIIDLSWFSTKSKTPRRYSLNHFSIKEMIATDEDLVKYPEMPISKLRMLILRFHSIMKDPAPFRIVTETSSAFNPKVLSYPNNIVLLGYWQSYKYFEDIRDILLTEFRPVNPESSNNKEIRKFIEETNSVGLHVRRGDFATHRTIRKIHGCCGMEYYHKGIEYISSRVEYPHFFVFSDDLEWVKDKLHTPHKVVFVNENHPDKEWLDLTLMSCCKHNIIANSSFSWWGAWLNKNQGKIVVGPAEYYAKKHLNRHSEDMFPPDWVRL